MMHVGVFFGNRSVEHEISIITALQAINQLRADSTLKVVPVYIDKKGDWYTGPMLLEIDNFKDIPNLLSKSTKVNMIRENGQVVLAKSPLKKFGSSVVEKLDILFPIMHGTYGEDGTLQGYFEHMQVPYVGCRTLAAAVTMDKIMTKLILKSSGVQVIQDVWFTTEDWATNSAALTDKIESELGYPVIVKPADTGSSIGVTPARCREDLDNAVALVRKFSNRVLVEHMVQNLKEINISVLGDSGSFELSVCEEPISDSDFLTFEDKYNSGGGGGKGGKTGSSGATGGAKAGGGMSSARREIPANLDDITRTKIETAAAKSFKALDCSGVCRIDFIIDADTNEVYVNEFNTIPGSLSFYLWEATEVPFGQLLQKLIRLSVKKFERSKQLILSNNTNILSGVKLGGVKK